MVFQLQSHGLRCVKFTVKIYDLISLLMLHHKYCSQFSIVFDTDFLSLFRD